MKEVRNYKMVFQQAEVKQNDPRVYDSQCPVLIKNDVVLLLNIFFNGFFFNFLVPAVTISLIFQLKLYTFSSVM